MTTCPSTSWQLPANTPKAFFGVDKLTGHCPTLLSPLLLHEITLNDIWPIKINRIPALSKLSLYILMCKEYIHGKSRHSWSRHRVAHVTNHICYKLLQINTTVYMSVGAPAAASKYSPSPPPPRRPMSTWSTPQCPGLVGEVRGGVGVMARCIYVCLSDPDTSAVAAVQCRSLSASLDRSLDWPPRCRVLPHQRAATCVTATSVTRARTSPRYRDCRDSSGAMCGGTLAGQGWQTTSILNGSCMFALTLEDWIGIRSRMSVNVSLVVTKYS